MKRVTILAVILSVVVSYPLFAAAAPRRRPPLRVVVHGLLQFIPRGMNCNAAGQIHASDAF